MTRDHRVQSRDGSGRWKNVQMNGLFGKLEDAVRRVTLCDEDGLFTASFRIVADGFMYTAADWRRDRGGSNATS